MSSFWDKELQRELQQLGEAAQVSLEKQRYNDGLLRVLKDPRSKVLFAALEVARVSQLDATSLDDEIVRILREQTERLASPFPALSTRLSVSRSELDLALRFILWWFSLRINIASPGEVLQNLRLRDERKFNTPHTRGLLTLPNDTPSRGQRVGHFLLSVIAPWLWNKLRDRAVDERWGESRETEQWWSALEAADKAYRVASLANFLFFLSDGRYRSLAERLLKVRLVPARNESVRTVSFELVNQQLLFEGFSNLLLVIIPLVDWNGIWRMLVKWKNLTVRVVKACLPEQWVDQENKDDAENMTDSGLIRCSSCREEPAVMPCKADPCGHIYCYFCLKMLVIQSSPACATCDQSIESSKRL